MVIHKGELSGIVYGTPSECAELRDVLNRQDRLKGVGETDG